MLLKGIAASDGIGIGKAVCMQNISLDYSNSKFLGLEQEKKRLHTAIGQFCDRTAIMMEEAQNHLGQSGSEILNGQIAMINDPEMTSEMEALIEAGKNAESAFDQVCQVFIEMFNALDDDMMRQRAADVSDMRTRILMLLLGTEAHDLRHLPAGSVLVIPELTPSMTVGLDAEAIAAIITQAGGYTSHAAILARALGIPAVLSVPNALQLIADGKAVVVDGGTGEVAVCPDSGTLHEAERKQDVQKHERERIASFRCRQTQDADGRTYQVYANIGNPAEAETVIRAGAEGVGLFRTEFLFMNRTQAPSEEEQFEAYKLAAEKMSGKELIIRTLDVGGDKQIPYLEMPQEENPFLGIRAVRYCLRNPDLYKTQLRALLRAGAMSQNIKIMIPMITGISELRQVKQLIERCKDELLQEGLQYDAQIKVGIMIETPAAVLIANQLANECDFFSIGTNDLTQYILAVDRGNAKAAPLYKTLHPAVLLAIRQTIEAAARAGIPVGMCGEAAADCRLIPLLLAWGLNEFSVSVAAVARTRAEISKWHATEAEYCAQQAMEASTAEEIETLLQQYEKEI